MELRVSSARPRTDVEGFCSGGGSNVEVEAVAGSDTGGGGRGGSNGIDGETESA